MSKREFVGGLVSNLAEEGLGETIGKLCEALATRDVAVVGACLAGLTGGPLLAAGILVGGVGLQVWGARARDTRAAKQNAKAVLEALGPEFAVLAEQARACGEDAERLTDLLTPFAEHRDHFVTRLPGYEKADLAKWVAAEVRQELCALLPGESEQIDWGDVALFLDRHDTLLVWLHEKVDAIGEGVEAVKAGQIATHQKLEDAADTQAEQTAMLKEALAFLRAQESIPAVIPTSSEAPPERPPLSDEDRLLLNSVRPFADVLTRYRIAVAEGSDHLAGMLEPEVERLRDERRVEEEFLFERARGDRHLYAGREDQAIRSYRAALSARPDEPSLLGGLTVALARARRGQHHGDALQEAHRLALRALEISRLGHEGDHPAMVKCLNNLAAVKEDLGRTSEVEPLYVQALAMSRRLYAGDHPAVAIGLNNLASIRKALGRASEAEQLYEQALAMVQRLFPGDHPDVAMGLNNLAFVRSGLGRAEEADALYEQALAMKQRLFPGDHSDVAIGLNNLAASRKALGREAEAEPLYRQALAMVQRVFPGDHPLVATTLINLASSQRALGRASAAEPLNEHALAIAQRLFPGDHPLVAASLVGLANTRQALGRASQAEMLHEQALTMYRRLFEGDHPDVAEGLSNLAGARVALGRASEAELLYEQAAAMAERCLPEGHPSRVLYEGKLVAVRKKLARA